MQASGHLCCALQLRFSVIVARSMHSSSHALVLGQAGNRSCCKLRRSNDQASYTCEGMAPAGGRVGAWAGLNWAEGEGLSVAKPQLLRPVDSAIRVSVPIAAVAAVCAACMQLRCQAGRSSCHASIDILLRLTIQPTHSCSCATLALLSITPAGISAAGVHSTRSMQPTSAACGT